MPDNLMAQKYKKSRGHKTMVAGLRLPRVAGGAEWKTVALAAVLSAGLLSGCATAPDDPQGKADFEAVNDPLEPVNRALFEFNQVLDNLLLKPVAFAYSIFAPVPLQTGIRSEEHTSELQSLMRISYAVFCLKKK